MKIKLSKEEWYPVYVLDGTYGWEVEVPDDLVERWKRCCAEFNEIQSMLSSSYFDAGCEK